MVLSMIIAINLKNTIFSINLLYYACGNGLFVILLGF